MEYGVTDELQPGASFSVAVIALTATGHAKFRVLQSEDGRQSDARFVPGRAGEPDFS
jgi:hypothetical protein